MQTIYLKEFIRTGYFGQVTIGSSKDDIVKSLGKGQFLDYGETQGINYGWYEFFWWTETGRVLGIQNDHLQADCLNHNKMIQFRSKVWTMDTWFLQAGQNITAAQVKQFLTAENIPFSVEFPYKTATEKVIKCTESGVVIECVKEYNILEFNEKGKFKDWKEMVAEREDDYVLNGITLFRV